MNAIIDRFVSVKPDERPALYLSFVYFFSLLCGYYMLRPIRDEMAVRVGVDDLHLLLWFTFIGMLVTIPVFGWAIHRFSRANLIPAVYAFFVSNLFLFFCAYHLDYLFELTKRVQDIIAMVFFVWVGIYNLFVISVFWSFMADIHSSDSARRLYGFIAAGGTIGTLFGSVITNVVSTLFAKNGSEAASWLTALCAMLLVVAILCVRRLHNWQRSSGRSESKRPELPIAGESFWAAIPLVLRSPYLLAICVVVFLYSLLSTFLYFMQADIVKTYISDSQQRIALFASIDFLVNALTLILQLFITSRLISKLGLALTLTLVPMLLVIGFSLIAICYESSSINQQFSISLPWAYGLELLALPLVLLLIQIFRRAGQYAINRPCREMLFTVVTREEKYKAKNLIDTTIYRGGDAISGQIYAELAEGLSMKLSTIAWLAVPISLAWGAVSFGLGRAHKRKRKQRSEAASTDTPEISVIESGLS